MRDSDIDEGDRRGHENPPSQWSANITTITDSITRIVHSLERLILRLTPFLSITFASIAVLSVEATHTFNPHESQQGALSTSAECAKNESCPKQGTHPNPPTDASGPPGPKPATPSTNVLNKCGAHSVRGQHCVHIGAPPKLKIASGVSRSEWQLVEVDCAVAAICARLAKEPAVVCLLLANALMWPGIGDIGRAGGSMRRTLECHFHMGRETRIVTVVPADDIMGEPRGLVLPKNAHRKEATAKSVGK